MRIAVEGCAHGELDKIYETIEKSQEDTGKKVDLLICCGDFQSTRNLADLKCMACPDKYKSMCSFHLYYSGKKKAPVPTLFIGGNHEASNYLQELPYGGWAAPNIYYMGTAGVVTLNGGLKIAGLSGIFKGHDYLSGRHECPPYSDNTMRSVYHVRNLDIFRLKQLSACPPDIVVSHDWPRGVYHHGDVAMLLTRKTFLREDIERDQLGSRPAQELMEVIKPKYWFSAHLHCKFAAIVEHADGSETKFLALDKCLPRRRFLQILDVGEELRDGEAVQLEFDPAWLAVLRSTDHLQSAAAQSNHMPGPSGNERWDFKPTSEELEEVRKVMDMDLKIPNSFKQTVKAFNPSTESIKDLYSTQFPLPRQNSQTVDLCKRLNIRDPLDIVLDGKWPDVAKEDFVETASDNKSEEVVPVSVLGSSEINLPDDSDDDMQSEDKSKSEGTAGLDSESGVGFVVDAAPSVENLSKSWDNAPKKKLKRRNQSIYQNEPENE